MAKWDLIGLKRQMSAEELDKRIKTLEKDVKVLKDYISSEIGI
jgi:hypothetical protein